MLHGTALNVTEEKNILSGKHMRTRHLLTMGQVNAGIVSTVPKWQKSGHAAWKARVVCEGNIMTMPARPSLPWAQRAYFVQLVGCIIAPRHSSDAGTALRTSTCVPQATSTWLHDGHHAFLLLTG